MGEPKAFASLSSGLLARKGAARPAMRPQGFGQIGGAGLEDLGWNDMGFEAPQPVLAPVRDEDHDAFGDEIAEPALRNPVSALTPSETRPLSPVHHQQAEIAGRLTGYDADEAVDDDYDDTAEPYDGEDPLETVADSSPIAFEVPPELVAPIEAVAPIMAQVTPIIAAPSRVVRPRAAPGSKAKAAFTLRLDPARHLKLRLACAVTGRSAQLLVTDALDQLLAGMPELDSMAERAPRKAGS